MRNWLSFLSLGLLLFSLEGCLFGGARLHLVGEPVKFNADQLKDAPVWVKRGHVEDVIFGIGSAYNVDRTFAIEAARLRAAAQLAASIEEKITATAEDDRHSDMAVGANSGSTRQRIEGVVEKVISNARIEDVFVIPEQVWGPRNTRIWRYRAYVLLYTDLSLADLVR